MARFHEMTYASKDAVKLFSPAIFDPNRAAISTSGKSTRRGLGNIIYMQNLVLDFENGDLRPEQFPQLFPDLMMIVTNSYGHTSEKPRFRVIVLTSGRMTSDVYHRLFDGIVNKAQDAGYVTNPRAGSTRRRSGLDFTKRTATSLFYLPCQAKVASQSFFDFHEGPSRKPLDPKTWAMNMSLVVKDEPPSASIQPAVHQYDQARLAEAVAIWRHAAPGQGHQQFWRFAVALKKLGLNTAEIRTILQDEARHGRSPLERTSEIPDILVSLMTGRSTTSM
jgi:hypothetical protein